MNQSVYKDLAKSGYIPLTLRIGVAGHRPDNLNHQLLPEYRKHIDDVYRMVVTVLDELHAKAVTTDAMDKSRAPIIRLVSSLAEGADRLLVSPELAPASAQLACILPFEKKRYQKDFLPPASLAEGGSVAEFYQLLQRADDNTPHSRVLELTDTGGGNRDAYRRAGQALAEHSDLLITLFDGQPRDEGGTWSTVLAAQRCSVPVIFLDSRVETAPRLWLSRDAGDFVEAQELTTDSLYAALAQSLMLDVTDTEDSDGAALTQFTTETGLEHREPEGSASPTITHTGTARHWVPPAFNLLRRLFANNQSVKDVYDDWIKDSPATAGPPNPPEAHDLTTGQMRVDAAYHRADALAVHYATTHRNTFVTIYLLGAGALIAAALGLAGLALTAQSETPTFFIQRLPLSCVVVEFVLLILILGLYKRDHHLRFHQKWLEYRSLAELLRPQAFFVMAGCSSGLSLLKSIYRQRDEPHFGPEDHNDRWVYTYAGNLIRWAGFDAGRCDPERRQLNRSAIIQRWLLPQIDYHEKNAANMHVLESRLAGLGVFSFWLTFGVVTVKLIDKLGHFAPPAFQVIAGFLAAFFPIVGTFAFAVRNHAEFGISAKRSVAMRGVYLRSVRQLMQSGFSRDRQIAAIEQVFSNAISESSEWRAIYEVKESETA